MFKNHSSVACFLLICCRSPHHFYLPMSSPPHCRSLGTGEPSMKHCITPSQLVGQFFWFHLEKPFFRSGAHIPTFMLYFFFLPMDVFPIKSTLNLVLPPLLLNCRYQSHSTSQNGPSLRYQI